MKNRPLVLSLFCLLGTVLPTFAQMKTGEAMNHYAETFGVVLRQRSYPYTVTLIESKPGSGILAPGEQPVLTLLFTNNLDTPLEATGKFDVLSYGTRGIPGDIWQSEVYKIADLPSIPLQVRLPAKGSQIVEVRPQLPETFGAYALVADLGTTAGRRFATSCVRAFAPAPEKIQYPKLSLDDIGADVLQSLGVQAIRLGVGYVPTTDPKYAAEMEKLDKELREYAANNITVMVMFMSGPTPQPLGRGRPHLDATGLMLNTKQDLVWSLELDPDFQKFVAIVGKKYGWPRGPVTSMLLWNEPWEGISISGWGADSIRYKEIFTAMAQGVEQARADGVQILLAGCDSSSNTFDKLFSDGSDTYLKWLDVCSIHYQGLSSPSLYRAWRNRKSPNGRVRIWDTESWVANTPDRVAAVIATDRAAGYDRAMGVFGGNIATPFRRKITLPDKTVRNVATYTVWPTAVAVSAAQHFIGERDFSELLFKNGLPWIVSFDGLKGNVDDGTLIVVGDLGDQFGDLILFRGVRGLAELKEKEELRKQLNALAANSPERVALQKRIDTKTILSNGTLVLQNPKGEFVLYDFFGNAVPNTGKEITVPLDYRGFYLRTNGTAGSFARLKQAVATAQINGYQPIEIIAHDLLSPVNRDATLRLTLTNILNRPIQGSTTLTLGDLKLDPISTLSFAPHETKQVEVKILGGTPRPDNTYPLSFRFDAGADGWASLQEGIHVNLIAKRAITIDGKLDDWKEVLPQTVRASGDQGPSLMEAAWLPFSKFNTSQKSGFATAYLAYDDKNFYFSTKIADDTPSPGTIRFEKRDDDSYFYPEVSTEYDKEKTFLKKDVTWDSVMRRPGALFLPDSTQQSFTMWASVAGAFAVDLTLPEGAPKKVSFYLVDPDEHENGRGRTRIEVTDPATGKILASTQVENYGLGTYATFAISGKVRVLFRSHSFLPSSISGIFFDSLPASEKATGTSAKLLGTDLKTVAKWQGTYGQEGYVIVGGPTRLPESITVKTPDIETKIEHRWPEGVRRYSYRKRPDLPFGNAPKFDNVQIAFNVIAPDQKPATIPYFPGTMPGFLPNQDTDYEYALNQVSDANGGGVEIWRCYAPRMVRKHFYPRQPASPLDGPVRDGKLACTRDGNTRIVECSIPWTEIPEVKKALDSGSPIKFTFRINDDKGPAMELAQDRSVSKKNSYTFHADWIEHWANEVEFAFEK